MATTEFMIREKTYSVPFADVTIVYEPSELQIANDPEHAKSLIAANVIYLTQRIAVELSLSLGTNVSIENMEILDGSVIIKFSVYIRDKLLAPALAGYMAAVAAPNPIPPPESIPPEPIVRQVETYHEETCKKIETTVEETIRAHDMRTGLVAHETTIRTRTIEEICNFREFKQEI